MFRILIIAIISCISIFPFFIFYSIFLSNDTASLAALFTSFIIVPVIILKIWKAPPDLSVMPIDPKDPYMVSAIQKARNSLDRFERGLKENIKEAYVKYPIKTMNNTTEHVWGIAHSMDSGIVTVSLINEPVREFEKGKKANPRETVSTEQLEDWMLVDRNGNVEGGFTHLAMLQMCKRDYGKAPKHYINELENYIDLSLEEFGRKYKRNI